MAGLENTGYTPPKPSHSSGGYYKNTYEAWEKKKSASPAPINDAETSKESSARNIAAADLIRKNKQKETTSYSRSLLGG